MFLVLGMEILRNQFSLNIDFNPNAKEFYSKMRRLFLIISFLSSLFDNAFSFHSQDKRQHESQPIDSKRGELTNIQSSYSYESWIPIIPDKIIIGYTTVCDDTVIKSVVRGVNVVIWTFISIQSSTLISTEAFHSINNLRTSARVDLNSVNFPVPIVTGGPDLVCVKKIKQQLKQLGYNDVLHLVSFGGWNSPHFKLDNQHFTSKQLYHAWKRYNHQNIFHGFDWDFEGHDNVQSPINYFTKECLDQMGQMSQMAKNDGYVVTMAPPESYLDFTTPHFSQYVNLTYYPQDKWHPEFQYHGANVYAYILAKYGDFVDLISIQLYESYSHAAYNIEQLGVDPSKYLVRWVNQLLKNKDKSTSSSPSTIDGHLDPGYFVEFSQVPLIQLPDMFVSIPFTKLVIGLATNWAQQSNKAVYISPKDVEKAYNHINQNYISMDQNRNSHSKTQNFNGIRGVMFWCMCKDEVELYEFVSDLNSFLEIRIIAQNTYQLAAE